MIIYIYIYMYIYIYICIGGQLLNGDPRDLEGELLPGRRVAIYTYVHVHYVHTWDVRAQDSSVSISE